MSLVEMMVSLVIFALLATGITSTTLLTYRLSLNTMESNTALTMGYGYLEQLKSLAYGEVAAAMQDSDRPIMLYRLYNSDIQTSPEEEFYFDQFNTADVPVEFAGQDVSSTLPVRLRLRGRSVPHREAIELFLDVEWQPGVNLRSQSADPKWESRTLRVIKTGFTEY